MSIIISPIGGSTAGGGSGTLADGDYGAFTVTGGVADLNDNSVQAANIADGELPPEKLTGYSGVTGSDGDVLAKSAGSWTAVDPLPAFTFSIPGTVSNGTVVLTQKVRRQIIIKNLVAKLSAGTCTLAVKIDGVDVTSLSAVGATSTESTTAATGANTAAVGTTVSVVISAVSSAADLAVDLEYDYE